MLIAAILIALGVLGIVVVHFQLHEQLFRGRKTRQPPTDIKRR
jgi:hypothetical protein